MEYKSQRYNCVSRESSKEFLQLSGLEVMTAWTGITAAEVVRGHRDVFWKSGP